MPVHVRAKRPNEKGKRWKIVEKTGRIVGQSDTKKKAEASARARNAASERERGSVDR